MNELTVRFPVVFGTQRDRPRKNVVITMPGDATVPAATTRRASRQRREAATAGILSAAEAMPAAVADAPTSRTARSLALATLIQRKIDAGEIRDQAHAAVLLGLTPANTNYVMNLRYLAAGIQERLLTGEAIVTERRLRPVARMLSWEEQRDCLQQSGRSTTSFGRTP